jgi:hypothetical protein
MEGTGNFNGVQPILLLMTTARLSRETPVALGDGFDKIEE